MSWERFRLTRLPPFQARKSAISEVEGSFRADASHHLGGYFAQLRKRFSVRRSPRISTDGCRSTDVVPLDPMYRNEKLRQEKLPRTVRGVDHESATICQRGLIHLRMPTKEYARVRRVSLGYSDNILARSSVSRSTPSYSKSSSSSFLL